MKRLGAVVFATLFAALVLSLGASIFSGSTLWDFGPTFYRAAQYLLSGENAYRNSYPHSFEAGNYPPYNPIWILYAVVPLTALPPNMAEAVRFVLDAASLSFLAHVCARCARLRGARYSVLLMLAPWLLVTLMAGQWTAVALLGTLLCYLGVQRGSPSRMGVGLFLALVKPNITTLVVVATCLFAYRQQKLLKTLGILLLLIALTSLAQPLWMVDLAGLYVARALRVDATDYQTLILPGYPWTQIVLLLTGIVALTWFVSRSNRKSASAWLWSALVCASLVSATHAFTYDWMMLMLPLAWLLQVRLGALLVIALYLYPFVWNMLPALQFGILSPALIPAALLLVLLVMYRRGRTGTFDESWLPDEWAAQTLKAT